MEKGIMTDTPEYKYLNKALERAKERVMLEKLAKRVPAVAELIQREGVMSKIMHDVSVKVQKHGESLVLNTEDGKTTMSGYPIEEAQKEINQSFNLLRMSAVRFQ